MKKQIAIEVKNLFFRYNKEYVLENINLEIFDKEYVAIIGPNGGGKTTFLKLLIGLLTSTKGDIKIYGNPPSKFKTFIGYLPQQINFNLDLPIRVEEIVLQGRLKKGKLFYSKEDYRASEKILKRLKIFELKDRKISELSGGQRQKVLLARALVSNPKVLILDEPTASIDVKGQKEIYQILKELNLTKIIVSHDIKTLFEGVDRVIYINKNAYIHQCPHLPIKQEGEHFCEIELFEFLKDSNA